MNRENIEIKLICGDFDRVRKILQDSGADFRGVDDQEDTYFEVPKGRLKIREATLPFEDGLIHYQRRNVSGPKYAEITVFQTTDTEGLKQILSNSLNTLVVVRKRRELFTLDNVKFHLDIVEGLGTYLEIEAQDTHGLLGKEALRRQCRYYMTLLEVDEKDLIAESYSDLLLRRQN